MISIFGTAFAVFIGTLPILAAFLAVTGKFQDLYRWLKHLLKAKAVVRVYIRRADTSNNTLSIDPVAFKRHPRSSGLRAFPIGGVYLRRRLTDSSYLESLGVDLLNASDSKFPAGQIVFKTPKGWQHPDLDVMRQPEELSAVDPGMEVQLFISDRDFFEFLKQHGVAGRYRVRVGFRYRKELSDDYRIVKARRRLRRLGSLRVNVKKRYLTAKNDLQPEVEYRKTGMGDEAFKKLDPSTFKSVDGSTFPYYTMLQDCTALLGIREGYRVLRASLVWLAISYEEGKKFDLSDKGCENIMHYYHNVYTRQEQQHEPVFEHDRYASVGNGVYETSPHMVFTIDSTYGGRTTEEHQQVFALMKPYYEQANKVASERSA